MIYMMCGIPGSGKSTYIQNKMKETELYWCSRDNVRFSLLKDNEDYFSHEDEVFEKWIKEINIAIEKNDKDIYIDATHLNDKARNKVLFRLPKWVKNEIVYIVFKIPLDVCIERNSLRTGRAYVPESVIKNMYNSFTIPNSDKIIYINERGEIIDG